MKKIHEFLRETAKQKFHTHIYALNELLSRRKDKQMILESFKDFIGTKYFHLHEVMGPKEIIHEISKYDFGVNFSYTHDPGTIEPTYSMGNKFASFFEAGLPILNDEEIRFVGKTIKKFGAGISVPFDKKGLKDLNKKLKKLNYKKMEKNIEKVRKKDFNIDNHISRLEDFIEKVVAKK